MTKLITVGSKKLVKPRILNGEILPSTKRQGNFDLVAAGVCPHDGAKLGDKIRGSGIGVTRVCETCGHRWYLNTKIKTCKCLTCGKQKRSADKRESKSVADEASASRIVDSTTTNCYNLGELGNSLTVGQRTLDPSV